VIEIDVDTKAYDAGHIRGAVGFNWQTELQDQVDRNIIGKEAFEKLVGGAGISPQDTVILYGDHNNWFAANGFWLFKSKTSPNPFGAAMGAEGRSPRSAGFDVELSPSPRGSGTVVGFDRQFSAFVVREVPGQERFDARWCSATVLGTTS